jgi:peptide/nickel transport system ATP-binding protein
MLYITHNLGIIQAVCENVIVMKDGGIVEQGRTQEVFSRPKHAYARRLLDETRRIQR